jgi:hypothetical protein
VATPPPTLAATGDEAAWRSVASAHFTFYYLPGSQAERDLALIQTTGEQAVLDVAAALAVSPTARLDVYLVNRIFWQGGASYPDNVLLLSYPDPARDYIASDLITVFRHEVTHALVGQLAGDAHRGGVLGEGVAVWAARGHYHEEPLELLAATLVQENADLYVPLTTLHTAFYDQQHEIAYLEGGAFVQFLIRRYGLAAFKRFLATPDAPGPIYDKSWPQLEQVWRQALRAMHPGAVDSEAVRLRVRYYDVMRRYEEARDPDARLLPPEAPPEWDAALRARFSRPNATPANVALEQTLVTAGRALWNRELTTTVQLLDRIEPALR